MLIKKTRPLLLTATVVPQSTELLKLIDQEKRYRQYVNNFIELIIYTDFQEFVVCENSNHIFKDQQLLEKLCEFYGKKIEFIAFDGNQDLIKAHTRAYGDQEIMEYAIDHSKILDQHEGFYKLTGRYKIKNLNRVVQKRKNLKNVFLRGGLNTNTVHTCFFKVTKEYFKTHFYGKGTQLNQRFATRSLERLYYYYIKQSGINMITNGIYPIFSGERGAGGMMDESPLMQLKTKIFAKLGVYDIKTTPVVKTKKPN